VSTLELVWSVDEFLVRFEPFWQREMLVPAESERTQRDNSRGI